jgi:hypothetical protein
MLRAIAVVAGWTATGLIASIICNILVLLFLSYVLHWEIENGMLPMMFSFFATIGAFLFGLHRASGMLNGRWSW